ncbi:MAG: hypothetical protein K9L62_15875 [Vallitaleaceae bacterium]|nr:hypothetical protein [Vallitaleaceae bacterium]
MKSLYLNDDGDVEFDKMHNLKMIEGAQEVIQRNKIAISINEGEWIFNKLLGIPWIKMMKDKTKTDRDYEKEVTDILKNDPDINEDTVEINTEYNSFDRELQINFSGRLIDGTVFESSTGIEV